jgi:hypothetical protein
MKILLRITIPYEKRLRFLSVFFFAIKYIPTINDSVESEASIVWIELLRLLLTSNGMVAMPMYVIEKKVKIFVGVTKYFRR